jgi:hypothetical protein
MYYDILSWKFWNISSDKSCDKGVLSMLGGGDRDPKWLGNGKVGPSWRGSFEIEKYEDALSNTSIVTPVSNYSCCMTIGKGRIETGRNGKGRIEKGAKREWGEMVRGKMVMGRNGMGRIENGRIGKRAKWQRGEKIREQGDNGAKRQCPGELGKGEMSIK